MEEHSEDGEIDIQVRSLNGESICLSMQPNKTIQELKQLLKNVFPPASTSPNFHLFLKGTKLSLQGQINSFSISSGEFLVLVPFAKKDRQQNQKIDESGLLSTFATDSLASKLAESAYSDLVQDLSSLQNVSSHECRSDDEVEIEDRNGPVKRKRRSNTDKHQGTSHDLVVDLLQSSHTNVLDEQKCKKFILILESVNCLSDPITANCILKRANSQDDEMDPCTSSCNLCICPSWLKKILKAFALLNIFSAFLQLWRMKINLSELMKALDQLTKFGLEVGIADIEQLSVLFPKVVKFIEDEAEGTKLGDSLLILKDSCLEQGDQHGPTSKKRAPLYKILNAMKKREDSFIDILSGAVKSLRKTFLSL